MVFRPPDLSDHVDGAIAVGVDALGELADLAGGDDLWLEALLGRLIEEHGEVGAGDHGEDQVGAGGLEGGDFGGKIVCRQVEAAWVDDLETVFGEVGWHDLGEDSAVVVVGPQHAHDLVRRHFGPARHQGAEHAATGEEEVEGPVEALLRITVAAEEVGFQGVVVGDAGGAVELTLIGDRIDGFGGGEGGDQVDLVLQDQVLRDFGGSVRVRLAVLDDEFQRMDGAVDLDVVAEGFTRVVERVGHFLVEQGQGTCLGGDQTDLDGFRHGEGRSRDGCDRGARGKLLQDRAAPDAFGHCVSPERRILAALFVIT